MAKASCLIILAVAALIASASAQLENTFQPLPSSCCLAQRLQRLTRTSKNRLLQELVARLNDWNEFSRYAAADARLEALPPDPQRVVFMGDSITQIWPLAQYFPGKHYVNRGISGQVTAQLLTRFYPDVIRLHPSAVIILAGTNDIARNNGPETARMIEDNFRAMAELAEVHGIRVILCTLTPVSDYVPGKPKTAHRPPAQIVALNAWIRAYAARHHFTLADYYAAVVDKDGYFMEGDSRDGLHPNAAGFARLAPVAEAAIEHALTVKPVMVARR